MTIYKEGNEYHAEDFLKSAIDHFNAAMELFKINKPDFFDSGGYLLHLSLELFFKSLLLNLNKEFPGIHHLWKLCEKIPLNNIPLKFSEDEKKFIKHLDKLYKLRYPDRTEPTEIGTFEAKIAYNIANKIIETIPDDLYESYKSLPSNRKSGRVYMKKKCNGIAINPQDIKLILNE